MTTVTVDARTAVDAAVAPVTDAERLAPLHPDHAVYTLFTSGSTGRPKGVTVTHRALMNLLDWFDGVVGEVTDPVIMLKTPYTFDVSVPELFWPLLRGATTVIAEPDGHRDPAYLRDLIRDTNVSIIQFVPSMLSVFLDELGDVASALASVQRVHIAGEALPPAVAAGVFDAIPHARAFNHYGPTEDTVYATTAVLSPDDDRVTIGEPVTNTATYILDRRLRMVPRGVPGELYLGGAQVARGYAAQPALTAERFIADPFAETAGERLYRTGDLVRWNSGGQIEYLGRTDFQVKLRGQRIELGEIEAVLAAAPGVVKAAATVVTAPGGADHLVAYLSPATADADAVRASLEQTLPAYMVPTMWTVLDDIALNTAGKVDRRALPAPDFGTLAGEYVAPATPAEATLAVVFADVLGLDRVSVTESFFDVGGNSLSAMRLAARAADALSVAVSVREVFEAPSVRELAAAVAGNEAALPPVTAAQPRPDRIPLSFAQQRMWFLNQFEPGGATYNIPSVLRVTGDLDVAALHAAVIDVVTRHEVLRTTFPADAGVPAQVIADPDRIADEPGLWAVVDTEAELTAAVTTGFDVTAQWPLRVRLWPIGEREFVLATVVHHIAADGESMAPLITDLVAAYAARSAGRAPEFAPLDVQFADFAIWQHEALGAPDDVDSVVGRQLAYWRDQLAGAPEVLDLPMDRPRPAVASHRGGTHGFVIGEQVGEQILAAARAAGVTPFMLVHAALAAYLGRLSATDDISIATPIAGRGQSALDPLIGMFVNTLVLRTRLDSGAPFTDLLTQVRQTDLAAFAHSDAPFETVVEAVDPVRSEAFGPLAQVILLVGDGAPEELSAEVAGVRVEAAGTLDLPAQYDLHVNVAVEPGQDWTASLIYAADLFDEATAATMAARFVRVLETVTADLSVPVGDVLQLTDAERADLLAGSQRRPAPA
ncbi:amino acid adenylation domain-containing protein, partial [Gordonia sp. (in: high G+C Gram-positive bacteria)]|uniref:amino acid adenylation domain-containing protein n=1 Tax=Gordonia sp. (in: high G+C Gram-positive bacteria) TaxID=84139 RepID=UPI003C7827ED